MGNESLKNNCVGMNEKSDRTPQSLLVNHMHIIYTCVPLSYSDPCSPY